jgi:PAS domain S-box-containing protein
MAMTPSGMRTEEALRETQRQLASELAATRQLQQISIQLINASDPEALYAKILDAAVAIMRSDFASMQMFYPERGELRLLAYRGFSPTAAAFWEWVGPGSRSTCGVAVATGDRSILPDIELSDFMEGSEALEIFRQTGIRAMQSTPLVSRTGRLLGMISTHWPNPHQPSERDLGLLDVLARQAADLIERKQTELTDQRLAAIVDSSHDAIVSKDLNGIVTTWNRGAERLFGYAASEIIGRPITTLVPPDRHHEEVRILDRIRRGERVDPYETVRKRSDASLVDVSVSVSPLRNAAGEVIGASKIARDITERKLAELALAERNTQLELASKTARVGSFAIDLPTGLVNLSPGCATILGLSDSTVEISRENARKLVHPEDLAQLDATREQAFLKKQREFVAQYRIIRADNGEVRWIEARSLIYYDQGGQPLRYIAVIIDTTERKLAEQTLTERNEQLALAGRAALVGSYAYHVHKGTMQVSKGYAAIHGLVEGTTETTISEWRARVYPEDLARAEGPREQAFAERRNEDNAEYRIVLSNGEVRWIERRGTILYGKKGRPERVIGVNIDVTERRRTEQVLIDRNRQLELAAKHALVGSFATEMDVARGDFKSQRAQVSPGFAAIYGLPEETVEISVSDWRSLVHSDDLPQYLEHSQRVFAEQRGEHHAEFRIVRPCGTIRWIEARSFIEYDQAGHARRLVGVNIDITERKRAEQARKILNAELDHRVKNTLATVTAVISRTREGSRSVADFAAALEGRIRSMAVTHQLLSSRHWQELSLIELIRSELAPYAASENTEISGPTVLLKPEAGQALAMVLHELATNAAKYGALSSDKGRVLIRWDRRLNGRRLSNLVLEWREVGGPWVNAPGKSSYGTSTIRDLIPYEFGGAVDLVFAPEGVRCRLELPPEWLVNMGEPIEAVADTAG